MVINKKVEIAMLTFEYLYDMHMSPECVSLDMCAKHCDVSYYMMRFVANLLAIERIIKNAGSKRAPNYTLGDRAHLITFRELLEVLSTGPQSKPLSKLKESILHKELMSRLDDKLLDCLIAIK